MGHRRVCPWWLGYLLASPIRRIWQHPGRILAPYVRAGMRVLEPGPGMGFFTLELARLVGPSGRVIAVDVQERMLASLRRRLAKAGLLERVELRLAKPDSLAVVDLAARVDLVVAIAMVHELPSAEAFFREAAQVLKSGAGLLLIEPSGHVTAHDFAAELQFAAAAGLSVASRPAFRSSHAAWLEKT